MQRWTSYDLVFFDCDSTLSRIEGIDELARLKGKEQRVGLLTQKAMDGDLELDQVYEKRLRAINPTRTQLEAIKNLYLETLVEDGEAVLRTLQFLEKQVYIISGGLLDAVRGFGEHLGIERDHIRAVELEYDELSGEWWRYYDHRLEGQQKYLDYDGGPLTISTGKAEIVRDLAGDTWGRRILIGDGVSDLATKNNGVDLFVGYGGVVAREKVAAEADVFITTQSLSPVLPLVCGTWGLERVAGTEHAEVFQKGLNLTLTDGQVRFGKDELKDAFQQDFGNHDHL